MASRIDKIDAGSGLQVNTLMQNDSAPICQKNKFFGFSTKNALIRRKAEYISPLPSHGIGPRPHGHYHRWYH